MALCCLRDNGNGTGHRRDNEGSGQRRDGMNVNLNIGCVCVQGSGIGGAGNRGYGFNDYRRGNGYETMFPYEGRRAEYCVCCGQLMRLYGGRPLMCCEMGWRPRFELRDRRRCGLTRCILGR